MSSTTDSAETTTKKANQPDYQMPALLEVLPDLTLMDDLLAGTRRMHDQNTEYIRKWSDEDPAVYNIRSKIEQLFEGLSRTLSAAVGMLFARVPATEWNGSDGLLEDFWGNVDLAGTDGDVFLKKFTDAAMRDGVALILTDYPKMPRDDKGNKVEIDSEQEAMLGIRPTLAFYGRGSISNWRTSKINNKLAVTQLTLWEPTALDDGDYGVRVVDRYRVLELVEQTEVEGDPVYYAKWTVLERRMVNNEKTFAWIGDGVFLNSKGEAYDRLPIGIAHTGRSDAILTASIPLLGVAWANLAHYQLSTALRFSLDVSGFPQPTVIGELAKVPGPGGVGMVANKLKIGPMVTVTVTKGSKDTGPSDFRWTAAPTEGFASLHDFGVAVKKKDIADLGMSFLASDTRQVETAEAHRLDATAENATLSTGAQGVDDAMNQTWAHVCWFMGIEPSGVPTTQLNRDFESMAMDPATMAVYVAAVEKAGLPIRLLLEAWQLGGRIPPDVDLDDLELQMAAVLAAKEEAERESREAQIATMQDSGVIEE